MGVLVRILKAFGALIALVLLGVGAFLLFLAVRAPASRPPLEEKVVGTPEITERGRYLFNHVAACQQCHSEHEESYGWPVKPGTEGGGLCVDERFGEQREMCSPNITPDSATGIGSWTDGELMRAVREGVAKDGHALAPRMPYENYREMADEDARATVAYVRTLKPISRKVAPYDPGFPFSLLKKTRPRPLEGPVAAPNPADKVARGRYLVTLGRCQFCHGEDFGGGDTFQSPAGVETAPNLSPHPEGATARMSREVFIARFKGYANLPAGAKPGAYWMPWIAFSGMTEDDLGSIYDYLKTVPAVSHPVVAGQ